MKETIDLGSFALGKNNTAKETALPEASLREALNVDIDKAGKCRIRRGYTKVYSGDNIRCLYKSYFLEGSDFKKLGANGEAELIVSNLTDRTLKYCIINNNIAMSDGIKNWIVENNQVKTLGIATPLMATLSTNAGSLLEGQYLVATQLVNTLTGEYSAASDIQAIDVSASGENIILGDVPQPELPHYNTMVYCSLANGTTLYYQTTLNFGATDATIAYVAADAQTLETQNNLMMPAGDSIAYSRGRLYTVKKSVVYFSEPMRYGQYNPIHNFWSFPSNITIMIALENGIFIVADKTYYIETGDPVNAALHIVSEAEGIENTEIHIKGEYFAHNPPLSGDVAYWFSSRGAVLGLPNGQIEFLSESRLVSPIVKQGASMYTEHDGIRQIITSLNRAGGMQSNIGAGDSATISIIRNGVIT